MALLWKILSRLFFEIRLLTAGMVIAGRVIHHFFATRQATKQPPEPTTSSAVPEPPTPHLAQRQEEAPATPAQPEQPDISKEQITPEISTIPTLSKVPIITPTP